MSMDVSSTMDLSSQEHLIRDVQPDLVECLESENPISRRIDRRLNRREWRHVSVSRRAGERRNKEA